MSRVRLQSVRFSYSKGQEVLQGVSFEVAAGERLAVLGSNGSGKSTLLLLLTGLLSGQGSIDTGGHRPGLLFQDPDDQLFCSTLKDDVAYGPRQLGLAEEEVERRVHQALQAVELLGLAARAPQQLSEGQKRRGAIATLLSMQPQILALDEPTSALDPRARRLLIELLQGLPQTMIVSTHDLDLARLLLPRSLVLDEGCVVYDGATGPLLGDRAFLLAHGLA